MVYISTDYVFDGEKRTPYLPSDPVRPLSVYGRSKLAGEAAVARALDDPAPLIVRTGWLYGAGGRNFVTTMLGLAGRGGTLRIVDDQWGRPTWVRHVAHIVLDLMRADLSGVWNVGDAGEGTWLDLARETFRLRGLNVETQGVSSEEWGAAAPRPRRSILDLSATEAALGRPMTDWRHALEELLGEISGD